MAKTKNKRNSGLADKVHGKRKSEIHKKKLNPFEVHINKEKIKVLGKKSKHDKGLPGVSRAKAIQKRKETIGVEMKVMNKTNAFIDRRIGEKNNQLSAEDRMIARFAAERAKQHSKKNIYNLADDEILTHRGQTLEQIEKFDDPRSDDEDDNEKKYGGLDDDFVSEGHFGGGVLSRTDSKDGAKSHKDLIEQLIAESKKRKAEKQKEKEQTLDLTEKLDSEWKDLQPVVFKRPRTEESAIDRLLSQAEKKGADYDKMMRELKFEKRGTPSDGLKSDEKQAKEQREKLELWEKEREMRMVAEGEIPIKVTPSTGKHRSAEDLEDNFDLEDEKEFMLAYDKEGKPLVPEHILKDFSVPNAKPKFDDGASDSGEESSGDDESEDEEGINEHNNVENEMENSQDETEESDTGSDDESKNKTDNVDKSKKKKENDTTVQINDVSLKDNESKANVESKKSLIKEVKNRNPEIVHDSINCNDKLGKKSKVEPKLKEKSILFQESDEDKSEDGEDDEGSDESGESDDDNENDDVEMDLNDLKDLKESDNECDDNVDDRIGSFFDSQTLEDNLKELLSGKTPSQQSTILQKLIAKYDPSLSENNKENLSRLFAHMLQYINDTFTNLKDERSVIKAFLIFDKLVPHFFDLATTNKVSCKKILVELLKEKYVLFRKSKRVPDLDTLVFFKLVSLLYPTSDFRHPVTTPSLIFMSEILAVAKFNDTYSISRGFFIIALLLEYTVLSKRLLPSAINFLRGVLYLAATTSILNPIQVVPPFRVQNGVKILNLEHDCSEMAVELKMAARDLALRDINDDFKIRCFLTSVVMLKEFFDNFNDIEAQECLFEAHIKLMARVDLELYPKKVASIASEVLQYMKECLEVKTYTHLCREKKRPKALRLYEPDIQEVFTGSKSSKMSRETAERARLQGKLKKEMKGALREIRRDQSYIASVKIRQKIQSDKIRKEKVSQIYKEASIQQGELNKFKRMK